jgi:hypothetical protein
MTEGLLLLTIQGGIKCFFLLLPAWALLGLLRAYHGGDFATLRRLHQSEIASLHSKKQVPYLLCFGDSAIVKALSRRILHRFMQTFLC